jgi:hypothetical protein
MAIVAVDAPAGFLHGGLEVDIKTRCRCSVREMQGRHVRSTEAAENCEVLAETGRCSFVVSHSSVPSLGSFPDSVGKVGYPTGQDIHAFRYSTSANHLAKVSETGQRGFIECLSTVSIFTN